MTFWNMMSSFMWIAILLSLFIYLDVYTNGLTEHFNQTLCRILAKISNDKQGLGWEDRQCSNGISCVLPLLPHFLSV